MLFAAAGELPEPQDQALRSHRLSRQIPLAASGASPPAGFASPDARMVDPERRFGELHPARDALLDCPLAESFHEHPGMGKGCAGEHAVKVRMPRLRWAACLFRLGQSVRQTKAASRVRGSRATVFGWLGSLGTILACH